MAGRREYRDDVLRDLSLHEALRLVVDAEADKPLLFLRAESRSEAVADYAELPENLRTALQRVVREGLPLEDVAEMLIHLELRAGIGRGELFLVYQPRIDIATRQVVGAEALLRWRHPERGHVVRRDDRQYRRGACGHGGPCVYGRIL